MIKKARIREGDGEPIFIDQIARLTLGRDTCYFLGYSVRHDRSLQRAVMGRVNLKTQSKRKQLTTIKFNISTQEQSMNTDIIIDKTMHQ